MGYALPVYVTSGHDIEIRLTLEAAVDLVNSLADRTSTNGGAIRGPSTTRELLRQHGFTRASTAPATQVRRVDDRMAALFGRFDSLPDGADDNTVRWVNDELAQLAVAPSLVSHDGAPLHIHWTPATASFDDQVLADILMALAQELCDHGTKRFGRCAAIDCEHMFYDATRNGSRRFCTDPRCASRTHTAEHRARRRSS